MEPYLQYSHRSMTTTQSTKPPTQAGKKLKGVGEREFSWPLSKRIPKMFRDGCRHFSDYSGSKLKCVIVGGAEKCWVVLKGKNTLILVYIVSIWRAEPTMMEEDNVQEEDGGGGV